MKIKTASTTTTESVNILDANESIESIMAGISDSEATDEPFYILDVDDLAEKFRNWNEKMPRVRPFYAVKCNDDYHVLKTLAALGTGFDCASEGEIRKVLDLGVEPSRIIYANPTKMPSHLKFAAQQGVKMMTFDCDTELYKVKKYYPDAE
jgi:ornithine decarboxylase